MTREDVYCINCKFYSNQDFGGWWDRDKHWCSFKPQYPERDLVTGVALKPPLVRCYDARDVKGHCSIYGVNYQSKDTK